MLVLGLAVAVVNPGYPHPVFGQASGDQAGVGELPGVVQGSGRRGLLTDVERFLRLGLYAEGRFERLDAGLKLVVAASTRWNPRPSAPAETTPESLTLAMLAGSIENRASPVRSRTAHRRSV